MMAMGTDLSKEILPYAFPGVDCTQHNVTGRVVPVTKFVDFEELLSSQPVGGTLRHALSDCCCLDRQCRRKVAV